MFSTRGFDILDTIVLLGAMKANTDGILLKTTMNLTLSTTTDFPITDTGVISLSPGPVYMNDSYVNPVWTAVVAAMGNSDSYTDPSYDQT